MDEIKQEIMEFCKICGLLLKQSICPRNYLKSHQYKLSGKRGKYPGKSSRPYGQYEIY